MAQKSEFSDINDKVHGKEKYILECIQHPESVAREMPQIPLQVEFKGVCESLQGKTSEQCILLQNVTVIMCVISADMLL